MCCLHISLLANVLSPKIWTAPANSCGQSASSLQVGAESLCRDLSVTVRMAALTGNFGFAGAGVFASLAAVLIAGLATAWNVRALLLVILCHRSPPFITPTCGATP